jgi:hypothetical protein
VEDRSPQSRVGEDPNLAELDQEGGMTDIGDAADLSSLVCPG